MVKVVKLTMSYYQQLRFAHGLQLAEVDILYEKNIGREEEHQEKNSNKSDIDDEDTNDTHEIQGVTVTTTTDPRHLHLSRAEVILRYNDLLQKVRKMVKLLERSPTKYDMHLQKKEELRVVAEEIGETVTQKMKVADLRKIILGSKAYKNDPESVENFMSSLL
ncbi:hypothetical protein AVEN_189450-1 [Araneus ventricosus]|uniref:Uncharacterized protein n=1 Tax=Araneus ventricosus TaxID=182803 RepID=A0A4Y2RDM5_ARAVE|nr:hypothetical protein AVEN_189450-1 [Araneus ventricosus]